MFELHGLHELDPSLPEDEWPLLELHNVTIQQSASCPDFVDLFDVAEKGPFRVKGRLGKVPAKWKGVGILPPLPLFLPSQPLPPPALSERCGARAMLTAVDSVAVRVPTVHNYDVVIAKVYTYALEQIVGEEGLKIWVLGKAGWYSITPAPEYRTLFAQGMEKAELWNLVDLTYLDAFSRGKRIQSSMESLVKEYYKEYRSPTSCPDLPAAWKIFDKHHRFLIVKMLEQEEMRDNWASTPLYAYCSSKWPRDVREIEEILEKQQRKIAGTTTTTATATDVDSPLPASPAPPSERSATISSGVGSAGRGKRRTGKAKKETAAPPAQTMPKKRRPNAKSWSRTIYSFIEDYVLARKIPARDVTLKRLAEILSENFEVESQALALDVLAARAQELCFLMAESQLYRWDNRRAFVELEEAAATKLPNEKALLTIRCPQRQEFGSAGTIPIKTEQPPPPQSPQQQPKRDRRNAGGLGRKSRNTKLERASPSPGPAASPSSELVASPSPEPVASSLPTLSPSPPPESVGSPGKRSSISSSSDLQDGVTTPRPIKRSTKGKGRSALRPAKTLPLSQTPSSPLYHPDPESGAESSSIRFANVKRLLDDDSPMSQQPTSHKRVRAHGPSSESSSPPPPPPPEHWPELRPGLGPPPVQVLKLPDTSSADGGLWECPMDRCTFRVLDANTARGMSELEEHYAMHRQELKNVMDTIGIEAAPRQGRGVEYSSPLT